MDEYAEKAARDDLATALHDAIDGDFLVGAGMRFHNYDCDVPIGEAAVKEVVWWAVHAVSPVVDALLAEARAEERERIALDLHERAQSVTWWLSYTGLARKDAFETAARIARGEAS